MALTFVEAAKLKSGDVVQSAVIELFARNSDLLRVLPFEDIQGNAYRYMQEEALPGVAFRGVNEGFSESTGVINPQMEPLVICGGDIDVDRFIVRGQGEGVRATHEEMKIKAIAQLWGYKAIKGDSETDQKEFDGLQKRLTGSQVVSNASGSGGGVLSLNKLDEAIDRVDKPTHLLMSKAMKRRLTQASRNTGVGGFIVHSKDEFGEPLTQYHDLPILVSDNNADNYAGTAFDEAYSGGGGSSGTSIYVLSLGNGMMSGIQNGIMDVRDLGEIDDKPVFRTRCEWYAGMVLHSPRSACRLRDIADGLVAA